MRAVLFNRLGQRELCLTLIVGSAADHTVFLAEESKQGFAAEEIYDILSRTVGCSGGQSGAYPNICFRGIMGMATFTDDQSVVAADFAALRSIFDTCRSRFPQLAGYFTELSIGMSDDYPLAIEYGSTMIRVGSMIFGERNY